MAPEWRGFKTSVFSRSASSANCSLIYSAKLFKRVSAPYGSRPQTFPNRLRWCLICSVSISEAQLYAKCTHFMFHPRQMHVHTHCKVHVKLITIHFPTMDISIFEIFLSICSLCWVISSIVAMGSATSSCFLLEKLYLLMGNRNKMENH